MEILSPNSAILDKTRELCTLILQSGEYRDNVSKIDAFFNDKAAQSAYRNFSKLGESLHQKQHAGELTQADIDGYDKEMAALRDNPVTAAFMVGAADGGAWPAPSLDPELARSVPTLWRFEALPESV